MAGEVPAQQSHQDDPTLVVNGFQAVSAVASATAEHDAEGANAESCRRRSKKWDGRRAGMMHLGSAMQSDEAQF